MKKKAVLYFMFTITLAVAVSLLAKENKGAKESLAGSLFSLQGGPLAKDQEEEKILAVLDDIKQQRHRNMNVPENDGRLLRLLAETIDAKHVVEIGTSSGYSSIWLCLALRKTGGRLTTHEIDEGRALLARENFKRAGVEDIVTLVMGDAHKTVLEITGPIDLLFIDADKQGYVDYLDKLLPLVKPGGLVVAHNMNRMMADPRFVEAVTTNPDLETLILNEPNGIGITLKKR